MKRKKLIKRETYCEELSNAPLQYAPNNELGVVFLFSHLLKKYGFSKIQSIKAGFPDCMALKKTDKGNKLVNIEFEYRSSSYRAHQHPTKGCDYIVCWKDDWHNKPKNIQAIELQEYYRKGFNIWIVRKCQKICVNRSLPFKLDLPSDPRNRSLVGSIS